MTECYCGSGLEFDNCCNPILSGEKAAQTPEDLMRSRYSAYVTKNYEYLKNSLHLENRKDYDEEATIQWAENATWEGLEIISTEGGATNEKDGKVEFKVTFKIQNERIIHHEISEFSKFENKWYFVKGRNVVPKPIVNENKIGRNEPCPCGSGKKYKKCCGK